jgi:hypothetical protein
VCIVVIVKLLLHLTLRTKLSKGQKAAQNHVNNGNGIFEVRSNRPDSELSKGDKIYIKITFE